jgi:hypothetical protein
MEVEALDAILMDLAAGSRPFRRSHRRFQDRYDHWSRRMERQGVPPFAAKNVTKTPLVGGQWRSKDDGTFDLVIVDNKTAPNIPTSGRMEALS